MLTHLDNHPQHKVQSRSGVVELGEWPPDLPDPEELGGVPRVHSSWAASSTLAQDCRSPLMLQGAGCAPPGASPSWLKDGATLRVLLLHLDPISSSHKRRP